MSVGSYKGERDCDQRLFFADDCALNASAEQKMQHEMDCFAQACDHFGLNISYKKADGYVPGCTRKDTPGATHNGEGITSRQSKTSSTWVVHFLV